MIYKTHKGFSLVELLVVISIIGVLASVVMGSINDARTNAQYSVVKQELKLLHEAALLAEPGRPLLRATEHHCTMCACRDYGGGGQDLRNIAESTACFRNWENALEKLADKSVLLNSDTTSRLLRDPWGSPYLLDENELEYDHNPCRQDWLRSAGVDGIIGTSDDYLIRLPFSTNQCP